MNLKRVFSIGVLLFSVCVSAVWAGEFSVSMLGPYLQSISCSDDKIIWVTSLSPMSGKLYINDSYRGAIKPSVKIQTAISATFEMIDKHQWLVVKPLSAPYERRGFFIEKVFSGASFGAPNVVDAGILLIGPYTEGVSVGDNVRLIGSDFEEAKRILDRK